MYLKYFKWTTARASYFAPCCFLSFVAPSRCPSRPLVFDSEFECRLYFGSDGKIHIDTPFSRLSGCCHDVNHCQGGLCLCHPPSRVVGDLTPQQPFATNVAEIQTKITPGIVIVLTLNSLYLNPRQFSFQLLWQEMHREGFLIEGFYAATGLPTTENL